MVQTPQPTILNIAHFNDVYQVSDQTIIIDKKKETINVTKFATLLGDITASWKDRSIDCPQTQESVGVGHQKDGLIVFSGDLFSPSRESAATRGKHMPAIINGLCVDAAVVGNHEFDFGYQPQLQELIKKTAFPWLLSNIIDTNTGKVPEPMKEFCVVERAGIRIGIIGLVERATIDTIDEWPKNFEHRDMATIGKSLSAKLRDPAGQYKCDFLIALTHSRVPNDIKLAKALFALSPSAQATKNIASEQGVDILLGGHDHIYWITKGVKVWDGYDTQKSLPDAVDDQGDVLVIKSGTDYRDLSEIILTLVDTPAGSIRKKVIQDIRGKRHITRGDTAVNQALKKIVDIELETINETMKENICTTEVKLDVQSTYIRVQESPIGNWITDCLRHACDIILAKLGHRKADGVIALVEPHDETLLPGPITLGDLLDILPFTDPTVVVELDANSLWDALENGLSEWNKLDGRFPAISGFQILWDGSKPANKRIQKIWLRPESQKMRADGSMVDKEEVLRSSTRKYLIVTGEYMVKGGDGYTAFKNKKLIIPPEMGRPKYMLIKQLLQGALFLNKMHKKPGVQNSLQPTILEEETFSAAYAAAVSEDMGFLDPYERRRYRRRQAGLLHAADVQANFAISGKEEEAMVNAAEEDAKESLPIIHPIIDGRMTNLKC
ncbi:Metallo-dependent phosphatase [Marasmius fiardii PR-910]|nr:Metallo-dependent phosphatase [Marasmius fiardii PR-910]